MAEGGFQEEDRGPGAAYHTVVVMESLLEKLKLLNYEEELLSRHSMQKLSRHYFISSPYLPSNPGEQFFMFTVIAAWLINMAGRPFTEPQEHDEPNATVSNILAELRAFVLAQRDPSAPGGSPGLNQDLDHQLQSKMMASAGSVSDNRDATSLQGVRVDFPPSKLKLGSGEHVCFVLDRLAEEALRKRGFTFKKPNYPSENTEEESVLEDDAELTLSRVEDELIDEGDNEEENVMDLEALMLRSTLAEPEPSFKPDQILESTVDVAQWNLEVERVLSQLKVTIRSNNKDWRIHLDQMHQLRDRIQCSLNEAKTHLDKLQEDIGKTLEKVNSREKYINKQLNLIQDYRNALDKLIEVKERYQQASGGVMEKTRVLAKITEELEKVKQEIEEKGSSMSNGAPLVKAKQSLTKLKQEIVQMDVRTGVVQHMLLQAKLRENSNMTRDMLATTIPEPATGPFT